MSKRKLNRDKASVEDIYRNKLFVPPKEQSLETIFEEPRQTKDGAPILTSTRKYKRYLHFDSTQNKIEKRKRKAKKCFKKLHTNYRVTRSSPDNSKCDDVSLYLLGALGDSSSDSDMNEPNSKKLKLASAAITDISGSKTLLDSPVGTDGCPAGDTCIASSEKNVPCSKLYDTPKRTFQERRPSRLKEDEGLANTTDDACENTGDATNNTSCTDAEIVETKDFDHQTLESPRRSCCIS